MKNQENHLWRKRNKDESRYKVEELEIADVPMALSYLQGTLDAASIRIESGSDPELEVANAQQYAIAGVRALMSKSRRD